jgi:hypothetical protein
MEEGTLIQLTLPKEFNYKLDVYIAKLRKDGSIKRDKTKAQILIALAEAGLLHEIKNSKSDN